MKEHEILQLDGQICFRLYSMSRKMTQIYQPLLEKFQITYPQYIVMLAVFEAEKIDFKELSERVNLKTGTLTPIVQKLEKNGFVIREKNPDDHRKINVVLSEQGRDLYDKILEVPIGLGERLQLTLDKYHKFVNELDVLDELLDEALARETN